MGCVSMVVVKYKQKEEGMFFSHLNMIRLFNRLLSIGNVEVKYSEGFNKTRRIYFSSPTRVGVESDCEYLVIDTEETAKSVESKIENILPPWMELEKVFAVEGKFNVASMNAAAKYEIEFDEYKSSKIKIKEFFEQDSIVIPVIQHGVLNQIEVKDRIYNYSMQENKLVVVAGVGDKSVRIDELVKKMLSYLGKSKREFSIEKKELYATDDAGNFVDIDDKIAEKLKNE